MRIDILISGFVCVVLGIMYLRLPRWFLRLHGPKAQKLITDSIVVRIGSGIMLIASGFWWLSIALGP